MDTWDGVELGNEYFDVLHTKYFQLHNPIRGETEKIVSWELPLLSHWEGRDRVVQWEQVRICPMDPDNHVEAALFDCPKEERPMFEEGRDPFPSNVVVKIKEDNFDFLMGYNAAKVWRIGLKSGSIAPFLNTNFFVMYRYSDRCPRVLTIQRTKDGRKPVSPAGVEVAPQGDAQRHEEDGGH